MKVFVTGGAGFIGSALVRHLVGTLGVDVVTIDALTYAGNLASLASVADAPNHCFVHADIRDGAMMAELFRVHVPDAVLHLAAESHVDRSIDAPATFIDTNVVGTTMLLEAATTYWATLGDLKRQRFRFLHVSTDEVYGAAAPPELFTEDSPFRPNSPYAASKAASEHLVRAWHRTYGLPVVTTRGSNTYGPYQVPEKLIPLMILNGLEEKPLPIYGTGEHVRDWLYVDDHVEALWAVLMRGRPGGSYNIGGADERTNRSVVERICDALDALVPAVRPRRDLIVFVEDRPGHDSRYALDIGKIESELGWAPREPFDTGLQKTARWYRDNQDWWQTTRSTSHVGERLGRASHR